MSERNRAIGQYAWVDSFSILLDKRLKRMILDSPIVSIHRDNNRVVVMGISFEDDIWNQENLFTEIAVKRNISSPSFSYPKFAEGFGRSFFGLEEDNLKGEISVPALILRGRHCRYRIGSTPGTMRMEDQHILNSFKIWSRGESERPLDLINILSQTYIVPVINFLDTR